MADITTKLIAHLGTKPAVTNLVSTRIHRDFLPGDKPTMPAVVVVVEGDDEAEGLAGGTGLSVAEISIQCYGTAWADAVALRAAIRDSGDVVNQTGGDWDGLSLDDTILTGSPNGYDEPVNGSSLRRMWAGLSLRVWFQSS